MTHLLAREVRAASRNGATASALAARDALPGRLLGPMTAKRAVAFCTVFALMALLGGCQVLAPAGAWAERQVDAGWSETRKIVRKIPGLRRTPTDIARFEGPVFVGVDDAGLNTQLLQRKLWVARMAATEPVQRQAIDRTLDNGVMVFRPGQGSRVVRTPYGAAPLMRPHSQDMRTPVSRPESRPVSRPVPRSAPSLASAPAPDPVSYVKVDGSLDMADWTACEQAVGGAFLVSPQGTRVAPDFDACMRGEGYVSEAEADAILAGAF